MVAVFMPGLKVALGAASPDHQSHADLPARIHEVSAIFEGGLRLRIMFDSMRRPGISPIMSTRHGLLNGALVSTATPVRSTLVESSALRVCSCFTPRRYMP